MNSMTRKRLRWSAAPCLALGVLLFILALPSKPPPEAVAVAEEKMAEWQARRHNDVVHGRASAAGPRPEEPPNPQISPVLVVLSFIVCMVAVAMFFMTLV